MSRNDRKSSPSVTKKSAVLILDEGGRVLAVACFNSNGTVTYTYDAQNQLLSAVNGTTTYAYTYDTVGKYKSGRYKEMPEQLRYIKTDAVRIICDKTTPINLDGELRRAQVIEMSVAKEKIRFFYPKGLSWKANTAKTMQKAK